MASDGPVAAESAVSPGDGAPPRAAPAQPPMRPLPALGLLTLVIVLAALTPIAAKDALSEMPPLTAGLVRFSIAAVLMTLTRWLWRERGAVAKIARRDYPGFVAAAALCVPINQCTYLTGVKWTNASHAGLFYALSPVCVYLITVTIGRTRWTLRGSSAALLAFVGAGVIGFESLRFQASRQFFLGDLLLLGAVSSWALYSVVSIPLVTRYGALRTASIVLALGVVLYLPAVMLDGHQLDFAAMSPRALLGFAYITVLTSYVNYLLWFVALRRIDINRLTVATNAAPVVSVVAAHQLRDEPLTAWLLVGAVLILTAITLANWDRFRALGRGAAG